MTSNFRGGAFNLDRARTNFSSNSNDIGNCATAGGLEHALVQDRIVQPATPTFPGMDAARALLVLAAECAFELRDGAKDNMFLAQLREQSENLARTLAAVPEVHQGVDCSLMLRRARQALAELDETIRREVLDQIDESTSMDELEANLQVVKDAAIEVGRALVLLTFRNSENR